MSGPSKSAVVLDRELDEKSQGPSEPRIRCPLCGWSPRKEDKLFCTCGNEWNTFDTGGVCPACLHQWTETQCLSCSRWSPHSIGMRSNLAHSIQLVLNPATGSPYSPKRSTDRCSGVPRRLCPARCGRSLPCSAPTPTNTRRRARNRIGKARDPKGQSSMADGESGILLPPFLLSSCDAYTSVIIPCLLTSYKRIRSSATVSIVSLTAYSSA